MPPCSPSSHALVLSGLFALAACGPGMGEAPPTPFVTQGQLERLEARPDAGQPCGGLQALGCERNFICADDPNDDCEPALGATDCAGICVEERQWAPVPIECAAPGPERRYVARDPQLCAALFFVCHPDDTYFFDECGCGCASGQ
ncbi:hypothetical protein [Melittangium boletus]|uniref:Lipoprotein n=1 Tax=Melittangium boletus DSM 14713 TaxID=1294270 RepID=A0A250I8M1_9BACT|nr:hypothetical protein [Melittangium boletus]ATB27563.1 hypothetical protein MEBOL_001007 [Melittangium boletus DSM 14713]